MDFQKLLPNMIRAAKLEPQLYEEVEHDQDATIPAGAVVVLASALSGLGALFTMGLGGFLQVIFSALFGWAVWSVIIFFVGTKLFEGKADVGEMLRVLGFAYTPMCLGIIPFLGWLVGSVWTIIAIVVATRQGLDVSTGKAVAAILIGLPVYIVIAILMAIVF